MSRAFVKESDGSEDEPLPELMISAHRNLVTAAGLRQIEATVERLQAALSDARETDDRGALARIQRDLRYWTERRRTAEMVPASDASDSVRFGSTVVLETQGGERVEYQIVGEDEADPAKGKISYVSPIAKLLIGTAVGDVVALVDEEAEVLEIR
jgi:transcription elongation GreA/GreB family factor